MEVYVYVNSEFHDRESVDAPGALPISLIMKEFATKKMKQLKPADWGYSWVKFNHAVTGESIRLIFFDS